ncbi:MAG TPA: hypothetical protein VMD53_03675 [Rhizomicrobium sp.]|nr:hypothetical protein [Rhizomicrobium sp.]
MKKIFFVLSLAVCASTMAFAQNQPPPPQQGGGMQGGGMHSQFMDACGGDMQTYCGSAQSRQDRRACMVANKDKFSANCKSFMANHPMHQHPQGQMQGPGNGQPQ